MRAVEVLDFQQDLLVRLDNPDVRRVWTQQVFLDHSGAMPYLTESQARGNSAAIIYALGQTIKDASCFYVTPDMTKLVVYAASQLDESDRIDYRMTPTRSGFVRFDGGLPFVDVRGRHLTISWLAWGPVMALSRTYRSKTDLAHFEEGEPEEQMLVFMWNDHRDEPDDMYREMWSRREAAGVVDPEVFERLLSRWGFMGAEYVSDRMKLGPAWRESDPEKQAQVIADGDTPHEVTNVHRFLHALWFLLGQTVTKSEEAQVDRARRKRAERMKLPPRVTVIRLRNVKTQRAEGESLVEWSHRWLVRGHPAWRACGPNHPLAEPYPGDPSRFRCRVWIAPFVKGPEDKPLIVSEKVYSLER